MIATVIDAVTMKTMVAAIERGDSVLSADAVTGGAAAAKPGTEPDQEARDDNDGPTHGSFGLRHAVTDQAARIGARMSPAMKAMRQPFVFAA